MNHENPRESNMIHQDEKKLFSINLDSVQKVDLKRLMREFEHTLIEWALQKSGGKQGAAAKVLSIPRTTLQSKLVKERKNGSTPN
ncbi:MAG: hypothetical protein D6808_03085 [Candidatus Dadabacteria bacterium]|nr:MAG: hypothetical protein D6808_03085 [Candidatus Dadabacteria bacterium]